MPSSTPTHTIKLRALHTTASFDLDAWARPNRPQPIIISVSLVLAPGERTATVTDNVDHTFSYGIMCKDVLATVEGKRAATSSTLARAIVLMAKAWPGVHMTIEVTAPKALLRCAGGLTSEVTCKRDNGDVEGEWEIEGYAWTIKELKCDCIIGVNLYERYDKQAVIVDLTVNTDGKESTALELERSRSLWSDMVNYVCKEIEASSFQTLEALATLIAKASLQSQVPNVTVKVEKPSALTFVEGSGVEITRDQNWLLETGGLRDPLSEL